MFQIKTKGVDINEIRGIRPAYNNFFEVLLGDGLSAIAELVDAVTKGNLEKEDIEHLLKLAPRSAKEMIFIAAEELLGSNLLEDEGEEALVRTIMNYAARE